MIRETFPVGPLQCNCSILGDEASREAIVVDPGDNVPEILSRLARHHLIVKQIIITHAHIDHVGGAVLLKRATGAPILLNENDLPLLAMMDMQADWLGVRPPEVAAPDTPAVEGMIVTLGSPSAHSSIATEMDQPRAASTPIKATIMHTPGHTEGSICLYFAAEKLLLAGDTLFAGSIGRTDLPGGDPRKIIASIRERLLTLDDDTLVICGHGPRTNIRTERSSNPFLI